MITATENKISQNLVIGTKGIVQKTTTKTYKPNKTKILFGQYQLAVLVTDLLVLNTAFIAFFQTQSFLTTLYEQFPLGLIIGFAIVNFVWLTIANFTDLYQLNEWSKPQREIKKILINGLIYLGSISLIHHYLFPDILPIQLVNSAVIAFALCSIFLHIVLRNYYTSRISTMRYVVVGGNANTIDFINHKINDIYGKKAQFAGRFGQTSVGNIKWLGSYHRINRFMKTVTLDKVFYINSSLGEDKLEDLMDLCRSQFIEFEVIPREIEILKDDLQLRNYDGLPAFRQRTEPLHRIRNKVIKRAFDILFSLGVILFVFPWLLPIIAIAIRLESKGPIFFVQQRTGYWNKPFNFIKFRSMTVNKESDSKQATKHDSRITKVGAFLRKTSLDEIPQFFNVLIGDMSIVGPRPHMLKHTDTYSELIETYMIRHEVKPGITGWAQVSGWRGPTEELYKMAKRVEFDVQYIENWTLWFDIKCIFLTVYNAIKGEENAF